MKERPILFSTPMVQAILEGKKTMTRRIVKPQPDEDGLWNDDDFPRSLQSTLKNWNGQAEDGQSREWKCPYGKPGDRLWMREAHYRYGHWVKSGVTAKGNQKWKFVAIDNEVLYSDDPPSSYRISKYKDDPNGNFWYKRLARFMPRSASRITLAITSIRVERLHDITDEDAVKEGIEVIHMAEQTVPVYKRYDLKENKGTTNPFLSFQTLWKSINGKGSWDANPWVWVIELEKING